MNCHSKEKIKSEGRTKNDKNNLTLWTARCLISAWSGESCAGEPPTGGRRDCSLAPAQRVYLPAWQPQHAWAFRGNVTSHKRQDGLNASLLFSKDLRVPDCVVAVVHEEVLPSPSQLLNDHLVETAFTACWDAAQPRLAAWDFHS